MYYNKPLAFKGGILGSKVPIAMFTSFRCFTEAWDEKKHASQGSNDFAKRGRGKCSMVIKTKRMLNMLALLPNMLGLLLVHGRYEMIFYNVSFADGFLVG